MLFYFSKKKRVENKREFKNKINLYQTLNSNRYNLDTYINKAGLLN